MEFFDEQIIEMRQKEKEKGFTTLETGIYVNRVLIEFALEQIFDKQVEIILPTSFIDIPDAVAKVKYPSEYRPSVIKTSLDGTANFTFNLFDIPTEGTDGLEEVAAHFQMVLKQVNPAIRIHKYNEMIGEEQQFRLFSYKSYGLDMHMYNLMCVTPIKNRILQACFNCPYDEYELWEKIAQKVLLSIKEK